MPAIAFDLLDSPLGELCLIGSEGGLGAILFPEQSRPRHLPRAPRALSAASTQLRAYFAGQRQAFELALVPQGTAFQLRVWDALQAIGFGQTLSYGELARQIGQPTASRAVGLANGRNPIPIVIPCHRVIGASGSLTGYSGGIERKRWLLAHEAAQGRLL